jgi:hypothetical protein
VINQPSVAVIRGRPLPRSESLLHENQGLLANLDKFVINQPSVAVRRGRPHENQGLLASLVRFVINPQSVAEKLKNGMEMHILLTV